MGQTLQTPFQRIPYQTAMEKYGNDKPDLRYSLELSDVGDIVKDSSFKVFLDALALEGGIVKGMNAKGLAVYSRKELDLLTEKVKTFGAKGLAWMKVKETIESPIAKFFKEGVLKRLVERFNAENGDLLLFVADEASAVNAAISRLRCEVAERLNLIPQDQYRFAWITDFPLLEYNVEEGRYEAMHHPFTSPSDQDIEKILNNDYRPNELMAKAYDVVLNGYEIGGGSVRVHDGRLQQQLFSLLGINEEEAEAKFGFLIEALKFGAPPHAGIALGLDRLVMILAGATSIREVIAFPKTQKGSCLLSGAPTPVTEQQLRELHIKLRN
jgi:aspartyl-tRNA synthetase